ncbi:ankyrin repeat domain-containing protein [Treponema sp.]|uniref:ankyrin repeat domain-containing protein n=1 Tax=Treponema sp. TaxID=166 RepID=UPI00388F6CFA
MKVKNISIIIAIDLLFSGCVKKAEVKLLPQPESETVIKSPLIGLSARACDNASLYMEPNFGSGNVLDDNGEKFQLEYGKELLILDFVTEDIDLSTKGYEIRPFAFVEVKDSGLKSWIPLEFIAFDLKVCDIVFDDIKPVWNYVKDFNLYIPGKLTLDDINYLNSFSERLIKRAVAENNPGLNYMAYRFLLRQYRIILENETLDTIRINPLEIIPHLYKKDFTDFEKYHNGREVEWETNVLITSLGVDFTLDDGKTPLMEAVVNENTDAIDYLLKQHADKNRTDAKGKSALQMADESKNSSVKKHMMNSFELKEYEALIKEISKSDSENYDGDLDSGKIIYIQNNIPLKMDTSIWLNRVIKNCELVTVTGEMVSLSPSESIAILEMFDDQYKKTIDDTSYNYYLVESLNSESNSTGILSGDCISNNAITITKGAANTESFFNVIIKRKQNEMTDYYEFYDLKTGNKKRFIDSTGEHTLFENPGNYISYDKLGLVDGKELGVFSYQFMYDYDDSYMQGNHVYLIDGDNFYESFSFVNNSGILQCKNGKDMSMLYYIFDDYNAYGELVECTSIYVRDKGSYHYSLSE